MCDKRYFGILLKRSGKTPSWQIKHPWLFGSVPEGDTPLNHWLSREGATKMQKGQFMTRFQAQIAQNPLLWDRKTLTLRPTHIVDMWRVSPHPLPLEVSLPDDKEVKLLSVYVGFICYVIPEQSKTCYAVRFALEVWFTTCCKSCLIIFRFFQGKISCSISFSKISARKKTADPSFSKGVRLHHTADICSLLLVNTK